MPTCRHRRQCWLVGWLVTCPLAWATFVHSCTAQQGDAVLGEVREAVCYLLCLIQLLLVLVLLCVCRPINDSTEPVEAQGPFEVLNPDTIRELAPPADITSGQHLSICIV